MAPPSKGASPARTPTTVAEAVAQLESAEAELGRSVPAAQPLAGGLPRPQEPPPPPTDATAGRDESEERRAEDGDHHVAQLSSDPCAIACRALASMARAADHVCGLAGAEDTRCADARTRVERASERVRSSCPACAP